MDQQVIFKTSLAGFDKKEVLGYIDELTRSSKTAAEELENELGRMREQNGQYLREQQAQREKLDTLQQELVKKSEKESQLGAMMESLNMELEKQQSIIKEKELYIAGQDGRLQQLQQKTQTLERKNQKYDAMAEQIGETILEAKAMAGEIIVQANEKAARVSECAKETVGAIFRDIADFQSQMDELKKKVQTSFLTINSQIGHAQEEINQVAHRYEEMIKADIFQGSEFLKEKAAEQELESGAASEVAAAG